MSKLTKPYLLMWRLVIYVYNSIMRAVDQERAFREGVTWSRKLIPHGYHVRYERNYSCTQSIKHEFLVNNK